MEMIETEFDQSFSKTYIYIALIEDFQIESTNNGITLFDGLNYTNKKTRIYNVFTQSMKD